MLINLLLLKAGVSTPKLLQISNGIWISIFLFRRPLLSVLRQLFHEAGDDHVSLISLSKESLTELCLQVALAPLAATDLRVPYHPMIYSLDASPYGGGGVRSSISLALAEAMWLRRDVRGGYSHLLSDDDAGGSSISLRGLNAFYLYVVI